MKAAAEAYRDEIAPAAKAGKFWERQTATFRHLWQGFESHELIGPTPGGHHGPEGAPADGSRREGVGRYW